MEGGRYEVFRLGIQYEYRAARTTSSSQEDVFVTVLYVHPRQRQRSGRTIGAAVTDSKLLRVSRVGWERVTGKSERRMKTDGGKSQEGL